MLLTTSQVAERLEVSTKTVYRLVADGHLTSLRVLGGGRGLRFDPVEIQRFEAERVQAAS